MSYIGFIYWIISLDFFIENIFSAHHVSGELSRVKNALFLVAVQQKEPVTVRLEEGMVLGCLCPWTGNLTLVSWTKIPKKDPLVVFHPVLGVAPSYHYRERIEFLRNSPMDGSISLRNVTHQDIGLYQCSIQAFPQGSWTTIVKVEDLGKVWGGKYGGGNLSHCSVEKSDWWQNRISITR